MKLVINPGTGPCVDANEQGAVENIRHFITDLALPKCKYVRIPSEDYGDGRFAFLLWIERRCTEIQMPGLPLHRVRFMGLPGQDVWDFPRLYVDGSSWIWSIALGVTHLDDKEDWALEG